MIYLLPRIAIKVSQVACSYAVAFGSYVAASAPLVACDTGEFKSEDRDETFVLKVINVINTMPIVHSTACTLRCQEFRRAMTQKGLQSCLRYLHTKAIASSFVRRQIVHPSATDKHSCGGDGHSFRSAAFGRSGGRFGSAQAPKAYQFSIRLLQQYICTRALAIDRKLLQPCLAVSTAIDWLLPQPLAGPLSSSMALQ